VSWLAFHLHYHERQDQLLEELLRPLVASLVKRGEIDSFFFVRYLLGGPHIRLRVRLCGDRQTVAAEVQGAAERFFAAFPSRATLPEDKILAVNREILKGDPTERDEAVYPDNFVRPAPFYPELERYGGPELLPESLAFFALSSCRVLQWLHDRAGDSGSRLSFAFHLLALQAIGSARDGQELLSLVCYPVPSWDAAPALLVERGDEAFERQKESHVQALRRRIEAIVDGSLFGGELLAERTLEGGLREVGTRRGILSSHLHMTANRIGLKNAEEIYLARLLWRTFSELASSEPELWGQLERSLGERAGSRSVEDLLPAAFDIEFG
jgi:hypothetical protein